MFKRPSCGFSLLEKYIFITFLELEILIIKQFPLKFMSGNKRWSTKIDEKLLSDLVIFSVFSSENTLDLHQSIPVASLKYLMYFLAGIKILNNFEILLKKNI